MKTKKKNMDLMLFIVNYVMTVLVGPRDILLGRMQLVSQNEFDTPTLDVTHINPVN